jgi:molybdopterin synthase sulfur carrier subunit
MASERQVSVLFFAWLRERVGKAEEQVALPESVRTVGDLIALFSARGGGYQAAFSDRKTVRCAVNQDFAGPETPLRSGDEIAFFPPVTGG